MWQEVIVGLIVAVCAVFIGRRWWKNLSGVKTGGGVDCGCKCGDCGESCCSEAPSGTERPQATPR